ncbi:MAG: hypothetical protein HYR85_23245 [Planctomycetes bacterium]|nr:hypothetical protein [Planctomycetota bacterium]MBI3843556.1 hypothetical protein [Planctomycetota bacterium]
MTSQNPDSRRHLARYYGAYACRTRGARRRRSANTAPRTGTTEFDAGPATTGRDKKSWARLLRTLLEVDPLVCGRCGARMQVIAVITERRVVDEILGHVARGGGHDPFEGRAAERVRAVTGEGRDEISIPRRWTSEETPSSGRIAPSLRLAGAMTRRGEGPS